MATATTVQPHKVQYWSGSAWTDLPAVRCVNAKAGINAQLGSCSLVEEYGRVSYPGSASGVVDAAASTTLRSKLVNLQVYDGANWQDLWQGVITADDRADSGTRMGVINWHGLGLGYLLSKFRCLSGFELDGNAVVTDRVGHVPAFNAMPGGDRSAATQTVNGATIYVHDRADQVAKWRAIDAVQYILATQTGYYDIGISTWFQSVTWTVSDPLGALVYELPKTEVAGRSVLEVLQDLIPASRGLTWRISFNKTTMAATINIGTTVQAAFIGGSYTLPANSPQATQDLTGITKSDVSIVWSEETTADIIEVVGAHPWTAISLNFAPDDADNSALETGWTTAEETAFDNDDPNATSAWSRFRIRAGWLGWQRGYDAVDTLGLANVLGVSGTGDTTHGDGGLTGSRSFLDTESAPDGRTINGERDLPNSASFGTLTTGSRQLPVVFVYNGTSWVDISSTQQTSLNWQISIYDDPLTFSLGSTREDQNTMKAWLDDAAPEIICTVGLRESMPLRVSWCRPTADWPREDPRVVSIELPDCELWSILQDTVTGLDASGTPIKYDAADSNADIIRDDRQRMLSVLSLMRSFYQNPLRSVSWSEPGVVNRTLVPGTTITSITTAQGTDTVNATVDTVSWIFGESTVSTMFTATPQPPSMEFVR